VNQMTRAVFFLTEEDEEVKPLMLESILFCPLLTWVSEKLKADGVERFFVCCEPRYADEARACFPADAAVEVSADMAALAAFLKEEGQVAVFPCAVVPLALSGGSNYAYTAAASALAERFVSGNSDAVPGAQELPGYTAIYDLPRLQEREMECRSAIVRRHRENGVRIMDASAVYIDPRVEIGRGTVVLPGTILRGRTRIGENCTLGPNSMVRDCTVGDETEINASQLNESTVGSRTHVGPFAYVRPNCTIGDDIKVGDFVEVKNSVIGDGTKISHLTYVGDSDVGRHVNFGCGTVTTNYDGFHKFRTTVGDHVFIGCNTNLVAPVRVEDGAYIAAGATITEDVPKDALAIARARQTVKEGWAARRREKESRN
jgi:bifunctional UDP-N-acetylglucosamine pyrophosphorylase/glucosamine-1-phosphate N-acetyltransferase